MTEIWLGYQTKRKIGSCHYRSDITDQFPFSITTTNDKLLDLD